MIHFRLIWQLPFFSVSRQPSLLCKKYHNLSQLIVKLQLAAFLSILLFFYQLSYGQTSDQSNLPDEEKSTQIKKSDCDKKIIPFSDLIVRPTGDPDATYTISFGRYINEQQAKNTAQALADLSVKSELIKIRDQECISHYLVLHGEFANPRRARQEMWRLLSFQESLSPNKLNASILFKPAEP